MKTYLGKTGDLRLGSTLTWCHEYSSCYVWGLEEGKRERRVGDKVKAGIRVGCPEIYYKVIPMMSYKALGLLESFKALSHFLKTEMYLSITSRHSGPL